MRLRPVAMLMLALAANAATARDHGPPTDNKAEQPPGPASGRYRNSYANPTALIAAEIALNQLAREKGLWNALRETGSETAELLVPERVDAQPWLKDRKDPAVALQWEPHSAWISCDGSYGVVEGGWTGTDGGGRYASVWQRQEKGGYKWLIRQTIGREGAATAPDMLFATIADCDRPGPRANAEATPMQPPAPVAAQSGHSADRTLSWRSDKDASGTPWLLVRIRKDGQMRIVLGAALEQQQAD